MTAYSALSDSFHLLDYLDDSQIVTTVRPTTVTPPEISLDLCESALLSEQLECYKYCLSKQYDLTINEAFMAWKTLKQQCEIGLSDAVVSVTDLGISVNDLDETDLEIENHAGILSVSESNLFLNQYAQCSQLHLQTVIRLIYHYRIHLIRVTQIQIFCLTHLRLSGRRTLLISINSFCLLQMKLGRQS